MTLEGSWHRKWSKISGT